MISLLKNNSERALIGISNLIVFFGEIEIFFCGKLQF